ncbi:ParB family chromosome partitioning protein [Oxalobacteraceae bacterium GrIS 2.11]
MATKGNKRMQELMGLTDEIEPTSGKLDERKDRGFKHSATQQIDSITGKDKAEERALEAEERASKIEAELAITKSVMNIPLDKLVEVQGRRRTLSENNYQELKRNLEQHPLASPISVRPIANGMFEITSGHNRVSIYKELRAEFPGRFDTIKGWIDESETESAEELGIYANLLHSDLPDFEKYLGFKKIAALNADTVKTHDDLAKRTGINRRTVSQIMSIDDLPDEAKDLLARQPHSFGSKALEAMAAACREGRQALVIEAMILVIDKAIDQQQAIDKVWSVPATPKKKRELTSRPEPITYMVGRSTYCSYVRSEKRIAINFKSAEDAAEIEEAVQEILNKQAERRRNK